MSSSDYSYLFPYEKVHYNSRIVMYGLGKVGLEYLKQVKMTAYCEVVAIIDQRLAGDISYGVPIITIEEINSFNYDYIVMAFYTDNYTKDIREKLENLGVNGDVIIEPTHRVSVDIVQNHENDKVDTQKKAYEKSRYSVCISVPAGIGDTVAVAGFIEELVKQVPECVIDLFQVQNMAFVKYLFGHNRHINLISKQNPEEKKYAIAFGCFTRFVEISTFDKACFQDKYPDFTEGIEKYRKVDRNGVGFDTPAFISIHRHLFNHENFYSALSCNGLFEIGKKRIHIPMNEEGKNKFSRYGLENYITLCCGNGASGNSKIVSKSWPVEYFDELTNLLHQRYPTIKVIQVGSSNNCLIHNADQIILDESFDTVTWILKNTLLLISNEGGLVHIASQLGTKCAVLFGPTDMDFLGMDGNINIRAGNCYGCAGLHANLYECARQLEKPECMYSITPEIVMERINVHLDGVI